jgi:putative acetyltransferase
MVTVRRFNLQDAEATRTIFVRAVLQGAKGRYSDAELQDWVPDPTMPPDWGIWLAGHITFVACNPAPIGFMMVERSGYLNMAFVVPEFMGKGVADALYDAIQAEARALGLAEMTVLASRYAQSFFLRHGWRFAPEITGIDGLDPRQGPDDTPVNRVMVRKLS